MHLTASPGLDSHRGLMHTSGTCWLALAASWASSSRAELPHMVELQSKRAQEAQGLLRCNLRSFTVPFHSTPCCWSRPVAWPSLDSEAAKQALDGKTYKSQGRRMGSRDKNLCCHFSITIHCAFPLKPISWFEVRKRLQMWGSFGKWFPSTPNTNIIIV